MSTRVFSMLLALIWLSSVVPSRGHGTMFKPTPRQPESLYWYQVGCVIGCKCSGGGKENYPSLASLGCTDPATPTNTEALTWNPKDNSPKGDWNKYMPWRKPGSAEVLDSCGIASGFSPTASVQYPHKFTDTTITQGMKGTELPAGPETTWLADGIVRASWRLTVNHGGGYQYRVCPKTETPTEACFQANVLQFATKKVIVELKEGKQISIDAVDLSSGTVPEGSTWRRLPLPACGCDFGDSCSASSNSDFTKAYDLATKAHGTCTSGLQFDAPHLHDGTWPDGYGYYVSTLGAMKKETVSEKEKGNEACSGHTTESACNAETVDKCAWSKEKCLSVDSCGLHKDQSTCENDSGSGCTWYVGKGKTVCYQAASEGRKLEDPEDVNVGPDARRLQTFDGSDAEDVKEHQWWITDELRAPSAPGTYILQWRWDNEQTPQVWTTCADIVVNTDPGPASSSVVNANFMGAVLAITSVASWL